MSQITNVTSSMSATIPVAGIGGIVTIITFVAIIATLVLLSKNIRQFFYGAVVTTVLGIIYWVSRSIGVSTAEANYTPLKWAIGIISFIVASIGLGKVLDMLKFEERIEKSIKQSSKRSK